MHKFIISLLALALIVPEGAGAVTRSKTKSYAGRGVSLELADPTGSIYDEGETVSFTIQSDTDAYVLVFDIDTEGFVHLIYPREGEPLSMVRANLRYPIPQAPDEALIVAGERGMEFVFAVSVRDRDAIAAREISRLHESERMPVERRVRVKGDPFLAANDIARQLIRGISYSDDVSLAYTYFYIGGAVDYPRYMCEDCDRTGRDPYGDGMPEYVATEAFDQESRLRYPLAAGFERIYTDRLARPEALRNTYDDDGGTTTRVYVSYYPRWSAGYWGAGYWDPWYRWYDPWYSPWGFYAGYGWGSGFYFGIGWSWGYSWPRYYYPYAYCKTPYYGYGYYSYPYKDRSLRPYGGKYRYKGGTSGALYTAMTAGAERPLRYRSKSLRTATGGTAKYKSVSSRPVRETHNLKKATRGSRSRHSLSAKYKSTYRGDRKVYSPRSKKTVRPDSRSYQSRSKSGQRDTRTSKVRRPGTRSGGKSAYKGGTRSRSGGKSIRSGGKSRSSYKSRATSRSSRSGGKSIRSGGKSRSSYKGRAPSKSSRSGGKSIRSRGGSKKRR